MTSPSAAGVEDQLTRIFASQQFRDSPRLQAFLRFIVSLTLGGRGDEIKESTIALEVFGREASFDANSDSIVRSAARRLRTRLEEYYQQTGSGDPVRIAIPKGSYVPEICELVPQDNSLNAKAVPPPEASTRHSALPGRYLAAAVAILALLFALVSFVRHRTVRPYVPRGEAYDYYTRAEYTLAHHGPAPALALFRKAVDLDPKFAAGQIGIAQAYAQQAANDEIAPEKALVSAEQAAQRAIRLEPSSADGHAVLGYIDYCEWKWLAADKQFRIATALAPGNANSWRWWALVHFATGRFDLAEQTLKRAATLETGTLRSAAMLAQIYYYERHYDQAIAAGRRLLSADPNNYIARWVVGGSLFHLGRTKEALEEWQPMLHASEDEPQIARQWAFDRARAGDPADLETYIADCRAQTTNYCSPWLLAQAYGILGDRSNCLRYLRESATRHDPDLVSLRWEPLFDPIRHEPEYKQIIHQLGF